MVNPAAYGQLQTLSTRDYRTAFTAVSAISVAIPATGGDIPLEVDGITHKYTTSMTPLQKRQAIAVAILITSILGVIAFSIAGKVTGTSALYYGLAPSSFFFILSLYLTYRYFSRIDYNSPVARAEETRRMRAHHFPPALINARYGSFDPVVGYALMGNAPATTYQSAANLCAQQAEADRIYQEMLVALDGTYNVALAPARQALQTARNLDTATTVGGASLMMPDQRGRSSVLNTVMGAGLIGAGAHQAGRAEATYEQTKAQVDTLYFAAYNNLVAARNDRDRIRTFNALAL